MIIKAVLSDMDGTLIDTQTANANAYIRALKNIGISISYDEFIQKTSGKSAKIFLYELFPCMTKETFSHVIMAKKKIYKQLLSDTVLIERIHNLLLSFKEKDVLLGLVTTASKEAVTDLFTYHQLDNLFDVVVTGDDVIKNKPFPDPYLYAARILDVSIFNCLILEDSDVGIESARRSGGNLIIVN